MMICRMPCLTIRLELNKNVNDMKKIMIVAAAAAGLLAIMPEVSYAQADVEIGKTTIRLQSPVKVYDKNDGNRNRRYYWDKSYASIFAGFSFPVEGCSYEGTQLMPLKYGNSFEITFGAKQWYRPVRLYAFGISVQYSHYDYRARNGVAASGVIAPYPFGMNIYREIFKTDNIGIGIYNRFFFSRSSSSVFIDIGAYGDWAFSRQYKIRYYSGESKEADHYRDGGKFLPLQGGVYGALGMGAFSIYCKYRFTHLFDHSVLPMEPPRLSLGLMIEL